MTSTSSGTPGSLGGVVAVVPAAGVGSRFGSEGSKTFATLLGRPLLVWALLALEAAPSVTAIIPVVGEDEVSRCAELAGSYGITKLQNPVIGGAERHDSVLNGLSRISGEDTRVLIHDGARPLVTPELVERVLAGLGGYDGAICAVRPKDTIKVVSEDGTVGATLLRDSLRLVQTPQAFELGTLLAAYERAGSAGNFSTDDAALVEAAGGRVNMVEGSYRNIKITTPEDLAVAETFLGAHKLRPDKLQSNNSRAAVPGAGGPA